MHISRCPTVDADKPILLLFVIGNTIYATGYSYPELIAAMWRSRRQIWMTLKDRATTKR